MSIRPSLVTAVLAGVIAAIAWPVIWGRWGGEGSQGSVELVVATLATVVVPAHALVVGFGRPPAAGVDPALLKRVAAWLGAAAGVTVLRTVAGL